MGRSVQRARRRPRAVSALAPALAVLALGSASLTAPARAQSAPQPGPAADPLGARLQADGAGSAVRSRHPATGRLSFVGSTSDRPIRRPSGVAADAGPEAAARAHLRTYGPFMGIDDQAGQLRSLRRTQDRTGSTVRFQQVHQGVPVLAGEVVVSMDRARNALSIGGEAAPDLQVDTTPTLTAAGAGAQARVAIAKIHAVDASTLTAGDPQLAVYDPRLLGAPGLEAPRLVWRLTVRKPAAEVIDEVVLVDARRGGIALHFDQVETAKVRHVCDTNNVADTNSNGTPCAAPYARNEGQPPTGSAEVDKAYDFSGATYDFYFSRFGRDSLDASGLPLRSTVRYCPQGESCPYANAYWDGAQMYYGAGFAGADDVDGHELTHGFTQFTSNLYYYYQSGAINESMSDVFGELVDLTDGTGNDSASVRWLIGEDLPGGALRSLKDPIAYGDPDRMQSPSYASASTDSGGVHTNSGVNNKAAYLMTDGGTFNGRTITGLGVEKVAQLYYYVESHLLTSGSDYQDLHDDLEQACRNLTGSVAITAADCTQVAGAVDATEMSLQPTTGAAVPEAAVCPAGQSPVFRFQDDMENPGSGNWAMSHTTGTDDWVYDTTSAPYATSGKVELWGTDSDVPSDLRAARTADIVPEGGKTTYLRFRHAYDLEATYDGGVVEYSTNGGSTWSDAGPLFADNAYNGTVRASSGGSLAGRRAFTGASSGYYSSRLDLSSLAGQSARFRFRVATDNGGGALGWVVDDVAVYTCSSPPPATGGAFRPLPPTRVLDTRSGPGPVGPLGPGATLDLQMTGAGGIPAGGVSAAVFNVAAVGSTAPGYLTAYPTGSPRPTAANLNYGTAETVPNLVEVAVGSGGKVSLYNGSSGSTNYVVDVAGWVTTPGAASGPDGRYNPLSPARILDTRAASQVNATGAPLHASPDLSFQVSGTGPVPASGVAAVVLNVAVTNPSAAGWITPYPAGGAAPLAANVNFDTAQTVSNRVVVAVGAGGKVNFHLGGTASAADVVVDVGGWFTDATSVAGGSLFSGLTPNRIVDTRPGSQVGSKGTPLGAGQTVTVMAAGTPGVPAMGGSTAPAAVVLNVAVTNTTAPSFMTVFPSGDAQPTAADLNWASGSTRSNLVVAKVGPDGAVRIYNNAGNADIVVDVLGWY